MSSHSGLRRYLAPVIMLSCVALLALVAYTAVARAVGSPVVLKDSFSYNVSAIRLLDTGVYGYKGSSPDAFTVPGYTLFLSAIYSFLPHTQDVVASILQAQRPIILIQLLMAVGSAVVIAFTGYRLGGLPTGWAAGLLASAYLPFGLNATVSSTETLALFLMTIVMLAAVELLISPTLRPKHDAAWALVFGVSGGLSAITRPTIVLWLIVPMAAWFWLHRSAVSKAWKPMVIAAACIGLIMGAWVVRNAVTLHRFIPLTSSVSTPFLDSIGGATFTEAEKVLIAKVRSEGGDPNSAVAMARIKAMWDEDPGSVLYWKVTSFWYGVSNPTNLPGDVAGHMKTFGLPEEGAYADAGKFNVPKGPWTYYRFSQKLMWYHRFILALAVVGVVLGFRRISVWVLASTPVYYALIHTMILFMVRYFYPAMPALILLAALGVASLGSLMVKSGPVAHRLGRLYR